MTRSQKQLYALVALAAVLVAVVVVPRGEGPSRSGGGAASGPGGSTSEAAPPPVADVKLEQLDAARGGPAEPRRNLFVFRPKAPAPAPRMARASAPDGMAPAAPGGPPPLPPIPLKFIGIVDQPARAGRVAVLSDGRGGTFYGREGDTIDGRYKVVRIGVDSAELSYVDGRGRQTIRLSGQ